MPRRVKIDVIGDAASYAAAVRQGIAATGELGKSLIEVATAAKSSTEAQVAASLKREARLRTEAKAAKTLSASMTEDAFARNAADNARIKSQQKLSRSLGYTTQAEVAKSAAAVEIESNLAVKRAIEAKIAAFRAAAADTTRTNAQREVSNALAIKAEKELARTMGITASVASASAKEQAAAAAAAAEADMTAADIAKTAADADFAARMKKIEGLELEIKAHKDAAASASTGIERTQLQNLAQQKQVQLNKLLADSSEVRAATEVNGNKTVQASIDETIALRATEIKQLRDEIVELEARARAAKAMGPEQLAIMGTLATKQKRLGVLEKVAAPVMVPPVLTAHDRASSFVKDEAARLHGIREEIIATEALATDDTLLSEERQIAGKRAKKLYHDLAAAISQEGVATKGAGAVIRDQAERQISLSIQRQKALQGEIALTTKAAEAAVAGSAEQVALKEKLIMLEKALSEEITQTTVAQHVSVRASAKASKELNTGFRGVLAGSGAFKMLGRSLAFASSGFLAFAIASNAIRTAVDKAIEFQKQMELIHTQAGASAQEVQKLSGAVERLAPAVGTDPNQLAKGLYHIESAGLAGKQAMEALKVAAKGAVIGGSDLEDTATALIATWKSGVAGVTSFSSAMAAANAIVGAGNMRMQDLVKSLSTPLLSTARQAGLSISEIGAALDTLTIAWGPNSNAAIRLGMAIKLLAFPTAQASKQLASIGISATKLGDTIRSEGLVPALRLLKDKMHEAGLTATQQGILITRAFGGGRSSGAVQTLIQFVDTLSERQKKIGAQIGQFGAKWAATTKTAEFATKKWHASVAAIQTEIGAHLLPAVTKVANSVGDYLAKAKNQKKIQEDFNDAFRITGGLFRATWAAIQPLIGAFNTFSKVVGSSNRAVELIIVSLAAMKVASMFALSLDFDVVTVALMAMGNQATVAGAKMSALSGIMARAGVASRAFFGSVKNIRMMGLMGVAAGSMIPMMPGMNNRVGHGVGDVLTSTGFGAFAGSFLGKRRGAIAGAGIGLGLGLHKAIGGTTGDFIGNTVGGAVAGFGVAGPWGALGGAAIGLAKSFIDLGRSGESAAKKLADISEQKTQATFAVRRGKQSIVTMRAQLNQDRVGRNQAATALAAARAEETATRGSKQHSNAVDNLRFAIDQYRAAIQQVKNDIGSLGSVEVNQKKALQSIADANEKTLKQFIDIRNGSVAAAGGAWASFVTAQDKSREAAKRFSASLRDLAKHSSPEIAALALKIADITDNLNRMPTEKEIKIIYRIGYLPIKGKGYSTPHMGQQGRADTYPGAGLVVPDTTGSGSGKPKTPRPIRVFALPRSFSVQEAKAITDKQEVAAARARLAYVQKLLDAGRYVGQAYVDALNERKSDLQTIMNAAKQTKQKGKTTSISKIVDPKVRDKVAKAAADYALNANSDTAGAYIKALKMEREWIKNKLDKGNVSPRQRTALDTEIKRINGQIASARKKTFTDNWIVPLKLQLAEAKAGATPMNFNDDLNVAKKIKEAAQKAIKSGKLGIQAQIDAWDAITNSNSTIAGSAVKALNQYHTASSSVLASELHLQGKEKEKFEALYAQAVMHHGMIPNQGAINGAQITTGAGSDSYTFHITSTDPKQAAKEIEEILRKRRKRNAAQRRGRHGGHSLGLS